MPYASQAQIEAAAGGADRLVELADWDADGVADPEAIAAVQDEVDGWIDGFASLRYATPIENPTQTLVQTAAAECVYRLRDRRGMVNDRDEARHQERLEWLKLLNSGRVRPSDPAPAKSDAVRAKVVINNRDESRENMKGLR